MFCPSKSSCSLETDSKNSFSRSRCIGSYPGTLTNRPTLRVNQGKTCSANKNEHVEGFKLGFPVEILICGLYRKVREGSRPISSSFHQNRTTGDLVNTQKCHSPRICFFSFTQYVFVLISLYACFAKVRAKF